VAKAPKAPREASAAEFVPVQAILPEGREGDGALIVMRDSTFRLVIQTGQVNWDHKSTGERRGITHAWGELIDSLEPKTPLQVVVLSKELDPTAYLRQYDKVFRAGVLPEQLLQLGAEHLRHTERLVKGQNLLAREVYLILTSKGASKPVQPKPGDQVPMSRIWSAMTLRGEERGQWKAPTGEQISAARHDLSVRGDEMRARLEQIGVWSKPLAEEDIKRLLNGLFNPAKANQSVGFDRTPRVVTPQLSSSSRRPVRGELEPPKFRS
jgi:hypothetical protein